MENIYDRIYLGDAVYVSFDGFNIILETSNGLNTTNTIFLEPMVFNGLLNHVETIKKALEGETKWSLMSD
jgi:hypothetical protein